jgi:hypothetical protein
VAALLRLVRALAVETHENWIEAMQYLAQLNLRNLTSATSSDRFLKTAPQKVEEPFIGKIQ